MKSKETEVTKMDSRHVVYLLIKGYDTLSRKAQKTSKLVRKYDDGICSGLRRRSGKPQKMHMGVKMLERIKS